MLLMKLKKKIMQAGKASNSDIVITEIGGTIGDIESNPFIEAIRQFKKECWKRKCNIHTCNITSILKSSRRVKN